MQAGLEHPAVAHLVETELAEVQHMVAQLDPEGALILDCQEPCMSKAALSGGTPPCSYKSLFNFGTAHSNEQPSCRSAGPHLPHVAVSHARCRTQPKGHPRLLQILRPLKEPYIFDFVSVIKHRPLPGHVASCHCPAYASSPCGLADGFSQAQTLAQRPAAFDAAFRCC